MRWYINKVHVSRQVRNIFGRSWRDGVKIMENVQTAQPLIALRNVAGAIRKSLLTEFLIVITKKSKY